MNSLKNFRFGNLARNTLAVLFWNVARLGLQLLWVLLLTRVLGAEGYGAFSGIAGLAIAFSGLAGCGLGLRMYQDAAREPNMLGLRWAQAVRVLFFSTVLLSVIFLLTGLVWLPDVSWVLLVGVAVAELISMPVVTFVAFAYASQEKMRASASAPVIMSVARVLAICLMLWLPVSRSIEVYVGLYVMTTSLVAAWLFWHCKKQLNPSLASGKVRLPDIWEGVKLSSIWISTLALGSLDKTAALRFGSAEIAGHYTAAQRFAALMAAPVDALMMAVQPRLFQAGKVPFRHSHLIALLLACAIAYGVAAGTALWFAAPLLPRVIGDEFSAAVPVLQVLSFYLPAYCLRTLAGNKLLASGFVLWRFSLEMLALLLLIGMMLIGIRAASTIGAAWALVVSEALLALSMWVCWMIKSK